MTASDNAAAKAADAVPRTATANIATLQTGDDSNSDAMAGRDAYAWRPVQPPSEAADAASKAADASADAAAATTGA